MPSGHSTPTLSLVLRLSVPLCRLSKTFRRHKHMHCSLSKIDITRYISAMPAINAYGWTTFAVCEYMCMRVGESVC